MINEANKRNIFHFLRKNCTNIAYNDPTNHDLTKPDVSLMSLMSLMTSPCLGFSYLSCQSFHRSSRGRSRSSGWCKPQGAREWQLRSWVYWPRTKKTHRIQSRRYRGPKTPREKKISSSFSFLTFRFAWRALSGHWQAGPSSKVSQMDLRVANKRTDWLFRASRF